MHTSTVDLVTFRRNKHMTVGAFKICSGTRGRRKDLFQIRYLLLNRLLYDLIKGLIMKVQILSFCLPISIGLATGNLYVYDSVLRYTVLCLKRIVFQWDQP